LRFFLSAFRQGTYKTQCDVSADFQHKAAGSRPVKFAEKNSLPGTEAKLGVLHHNGYGRSDEAGLYVGVGITLGVAVAAAAVFRKTGRRRFWPISVRTLKVNFPLFVLCWDFQDTPLHIDRCIHELEKLSFDDAFERDECRRRWW